MADFEKLSIDSRRARCILPSGIAPAFACLQPLRTGITRSNQYAVGAEVARYVHDDDDVFLEISTATMSARVGLGRGLNDRARIRQGIVRYCAREGDRDLIETAQKSIESRDASDCDSVRHKKRYSNIGRGREEGCTGAVSSKTVSSESATNPPNTSS